VSVFIGFILYLNSPSPVNSLGGSKGLGKSFAFLDRINADIQRLLTKKAMHRESLRLRDCFGHHQCNTAWCLLCASRRARKQREHLMTALPEILRDRRLQVWHVTGCSADSDDIRVHALAAMNGMRRLLKQPRLIGRVVTFFACLEVEYKAYRSTPCAHCHALVVTRDITKGRNYISEPDWIAMWEEVNPLHRLRPADDDLTRRYTPKNPRKDTSIKAVLVKKPNDVNELDHLARYVTYWGTPNNAARYYRQLLKDPDLFIRHTKALFRVPRFIGPLHKG
jgi:hypothetical protein